MPEITEQEQAVLDAVDAWFEQCALANGPELMSPAERRLADAHMVLKPSEPPHRSVVIDRTGDAWQRESDTADPQRWRMVGREDWRDWAFLVRNWGPLTRLVPESETVPVDLARSMAHALQVLLLAATDGNLPLPSTVHQARTALAEAEKAVA